MNQRMARDEALAVLEGKSYTEIVKHLHSLGVKGRRRDADHCPIAEYVTYMTGVPHSVGVLWCSPTDLRKDEKTILPSSVRYFIDWFDKFGCAGLEYDD